MLLQENIPARYPESRALMDDLGLWWVLHIKPNCEKQMAAYLLNRNISYYLPLYQRSARVGYFKKVRIRKVPLFSGYICFALDRRKHHLLYDTKKFVRIMKVEDQEAFVRELQAVSIAMQVETDPVVRPGLVPGKRVLILSGVLKGIQGVVVRGRNQRRLALSIQMFNQSMLLKLDPTVAVEILP